MVSVFRANAAIAAAAAADCINRVVLSNYGAVEGPPVNVEELRRWWLVYGMSECPQLASGRWPPIIVFRYDILDFIQFAKDFLVCPNPTCFLVSKKMFVSSQHVMLGDTVLTWGVLRYLDMVH